jgi:hypothetical protein
MQQVPHEIENSKWTEIIEEQGIPSCFACESRYPGVDGADLCCGDHTLAVL